MLEASFGGINLEDIAQLKCFHILETLRQRLRNPIWHEDQQGTAFIVLAGLLNALELVDKRIRGARIGLLGVGATNTAAYRLMKAAVADPNGMVLCDSRGTLLRGRPDLAAAPSNFVEKWQIACESNSAGLRGSISEAMRGADVCLAFSAPGPNVVCPCGSAGRRATR